MLLIGAPGRPFRDAAELAREIGAEVEMADDIDGAMLALRDHGADLALIDVDLNVTAFINQLRIERFALPVLACGVDAAAERAVAAIRAGARDYVPLPPDRALIAAAIASVVAERSMRVLGKDAELKRVSDLATAMARSGAPMLLTGEPGTGKELMARKIHEASGRKGPILVVECAGVASEVIESELFGHEQNAFPGAAARRIGRLEKAGEGTVFIREVSALSPGTQAKLLGALQAFQIRRVGSDTPVPICARVIASTSIDLSERVSEGTFRADLLARLGLARIEMPPLRARGDDVVLLAEDFAERFARADGLPPRRFSAEAIDLIRYYGWPGNIRELEDAVHRAVLLATGKEITPEEIVLADGARIQPRPAPTGDQPAGLQVDRLVGHTVEEVERELILSTLRRCQGNRTSASNILGISVRTMRNKLKAFIEAGIPVSPA